MGTQTNAAWEKKNNNNNITVVADVGKEGPGFLFSIFLKSRVRVTSSKSVGLQ